MSPAAETIITALSVGGLSPRQVAELQEVYWTLSQDEQDAIDRWTSIARQVRALRPGCTAPIEEDAREVFASMVEVERDRLRDRGAWLILERGSKSRLGRFALWLLRRCT